MVDKKDLRVGNLLMHGNDVVEVEEIGDDGINICWMHELTCWDYDFKNLSPIELTPEWLGRMGFKRSNISGWEYERKVGALNWYFRFNTEWYSEIGDIYIDSKIRYVHDAQNLYYAFLRHEIEIINTK